jgi:hypothetical protein
VRTGRAISSTSSDSRSYLIEKWRHEVTEAESFNMASLEATESTIVGGETQYQAVSSEILQIIDEGAQPQLSNDSTSDTVLQQHYPSLRTATSSSSNISQRLPGTTPRCQRRRRQCRRMLCIVLLVIFSLSAIIVPIVLYNIKHW